MKTDRLLTQNSEMRKAGVWNWTIPAHWVRVDGKIFHTCPQAGVCAQVCYAKFGTYLFPKVKAKHLRNLKRVLDDPIKWENDMVGELSHPRYRMTGIPTELPQSNNEWLENWRIAGGRAVRIHDAGDFFAEWYLGTWFDIATRVPDVLFYAYTKEVSLFEGLAKPIPPNFHYLYSTGGLEDGLIPLNARRADVFSTLAQMDEAGYVDQSENDLLAIFLPTRYVGIPANKIPGANKLMAGRSLSEIANARIAAAQT